MPTGSRIDPYGAYNFLVEIDGITRAGFQEVAGLDSTQEAGDYREGTDPLTARKLPGLNTYSAISLKRGFTDDDELWLWRKRAMDGKVERRNLSIVLLDDAREEKLRWNVREAWPSKWEGPSLNAGGSDVAIESLELAHEGVEWAS